MTDINLLYKVGQNVKKSKAQVTTGQDGKTESLQHAAIR